MSWYPIQLIAHFTLKCPGLDNKLDGYPTYELPRLDLLKTNLNVEKQMSTTLQREAGKGD